MLPSSFDDYIPKNYTRDDKLNAFSAKMDEIIAYLKAETTGLNDLIDPVKIPASLIVELGAYLNAGINELDSETIRRQKVADAVAAHKRRGSFNLDAKPKIDAIAGGDSSIFHGWELDDWILIGDGLTPSAYYWAAMGCDGIDDELGISLIGEGIEVQVAGNIYIDVDNNSLSASEQEQIRLDMLDIVPCYYNVHIGYVDGLGNFQEYFMMGA